VGPVLGPQQVAGHGQRGALHVPESGMLGRAQGPHLRGQDRIDPDLTIGALDRMAAHLARAARDRSRVLLATGHVAREDGRLSDAMAAYGAAAARANELGDDLIEIAAEAGAGLAALDQGDVASAEGRLRRAEEMLAAAPSPGWFAGRELVDALAIRVAATAGHAGLAADRFDSALALAEPNDTFAATALVAECAPALVGVGLRAMGATIERVRYAAVASGFDRLAAKLRA